MKFYVSVAIDGRFHVEVDAQNLEEAKEKAMLETQEADFGCLECIDWACVNAEDEASNLHDYI